jgi:hypothetical protein
MLKACLTYVSNIAAKISRILARHNIQTIYLPPTKLREELVQAKDPIGLHRRGIYHIPCECCRNTDATFDSANQKKNSSSRTHELGKSSNALGKHQVGLGWVTVKREDIGTE